MGKEVNCEVCGAQCYKLCLTYGVFICSRCKYKPAWGETEIYAKQSKLETATLVSRMQMTKEVCVKYYTEKLFEYWLSHPQYSDHEDDYFGRIKCILV